MFYALKLTLWLAFRIAFLPLEAVRSASILLFKICEFFRISVLARFVYAAGIFALAYPYFVPQAVSADMLALTNLLFFPWTCGLAVITCLLRGFGNPVPVLRPFWRIKRPVKGEPRVKQRKEQPVTLAACHGLFPSVPNGDVLHHLPMQAQVLIVNGKEEMEASESSLTNSIS